MRRRRGKRRTWRRKGVDSTSQTSKLLVANNFGSSSVHSVSLSLSESHSQSVSSLSLLTSLSLSLSFILTVYDSLSSPHTFSLSHSLSLSFFPSLFSLSFSLPFIIAVFSILAHFLAPTEKPEFNLRSVDSFTKQFLKTFL